MKCNPILLDGISDTGRILDRIESQAGDPKDEAWLQALIHTRPELLPVSDFDEGIGDLIPLGREINTSAGPIDLAFTTRQGQLVVVETKLWKNPEKHRVVVAQVIDYAKEMATWSYDDLNSAVIAAARGMKESPARSIQDRIAPLFADSKRDFHEFQESLIASLNHGRFLLLIVGDRISPNVAMLSAAIHGAPGLEFQFGLVELQMHPMQADQDWPLLIVPEIVGRTVEETRAVVKVQYEKSQPEVEVVVSADGNEKQAKSKTSLTNLRAQLPEDMQPVFEHWCEVWREKGYAFNFGIWGIGFHAPIRGVLRSVFNLDPDQISVRYLRKYKSIELTPEQYRTYLDDLDAVPVARERIAAGHRVIPLHMITADDYDAIFRVNVKLADTLADKENTES